MSRTAVIALILTAIVGVAAFLVFELRSGDTQPPTTTAHASSPSIVATSATQPEAKLPIGPEAKVAETTADAVVASNRESQAVSGFEAHTLTMCHRELLKKKGLELFSCEGINEDDTLALNHCRSQVAGVSRRLQEATARTESCPQSLAHPSEYFEAIKVLAELGDVAAQRCFVQGHFGVFKEVGMNLSQAERDEYVPLARRFIDARLEQGDWSVVRWLAKARLDTSDFLLAMAYPIGTSHPETIYKMNLLLLLGNQPGGSSNTQNDDPKRIVNFYRQQKRLTPEQFEEAERWAKAMYGQHFNGSQEGASISFDNFCGASQ